MTANPIATTKARAADCTTTFTGILAANVEGKFCFPVYLHKLARYKCANFITGVYKSLTLNAKNQVAYHGDAKNPLKIEFQVSGRPVFKIVS